MKKFQTCAMHKDQIVVPRIYMDAFVQFCLNSKLGVIIMNSDQYFYVVNPLPFFSTDELTVETKLIIVDQFNSKLNEQESIQFHQTSSSEQELV